MVASRNEYFCLVCGMELDARDFRDKRDADICGHCFADRMTQVRQRRTFAPGLNDVGRSRELAIQADVEIHLQHARDNGNTEAVEAYERVIRMLES